MDMIERVARALAWEHVRSEQHWQEWNDAARAAIEAMREPTEEMLEAGREAYAETGDVRDAYVAMMCTAFSREFAY